MKVAHHNDPLAGVTRLTFRVGALEWRPSCLGPGPLTLPLHARTRALRKVPLSA
jgi:hypothetical protein